ncbi:TPA: hypothetical protein DF272_01320 [Candidatus Falkowbacteria bacterium]|nr:hypothetical protein [Candidatus Falkowbacteria bacterium]
MNIHARRFLAYSFILAFVIIAPILIFYTAGYRYNPKKQQLATTGTLVVETAPRAARLTLNQEVEYQTPIRLTDLTPQKYTIEISKDGYYPWKKNLTINSQETTFAEDIVLFKKTDPKKLFDFRVTAMAETPDRKGAAILSHNENELDIYYYAFGSKTVQKIYNTTDTLNEPNLSWSKDGNFLLLTFAEPALSGVIINRTAPSIKITVAEFMANAVKVKFSLEEDNILYAVSGDKIIQATIQNRILVTETVDNYNPVKQADFNIYNDYLYLISSDRNQETIIERHRVGVPADRPEAKIILPTAEYTIPGVVDDHLVILDKTSDTTYFVSLGLGEILTGVTELSSYYYKEKENLLLVADKNEIAVFDLDAGEKTTITRVSDGISHVSWYPEINYVVYAFQNRAKIIELDERDYRLQWDLPIDDINDMVLDRKGEFIYYFKNTEPGLFALEIH